jgi:hypothetical protein
VHYAPGCMGLLCDRTEYCDLEAEPVKRRVNRSHQSKKKWVIVTAAFRSPPT